MAPASLALQSRLYASTRLDSDMPRADPDRAALEIAHHALQTTMSLDDMLKQRHFELILKCLARRHMQRRARIDVKKLQANDHD